MTENYKHLYEQAKKMLVMYQDKIVPGFREKIEDMEKNMAEVVRCKDCKYYRTGEYFDDIQFCFRLRHPTEDKQIGYNFSDDDFCSRGERKGE